MTPALAVFLKAPRLGTVKTRLAAEIGARQALRLYRVMAARTLAEVRQAGLEATVWFTPADAASRDAALARRSWDLRPQASGDLGARLAAAAQRGRRRAAAGSPSGRTVRGSTRALLREAAAIVERGRDRARAQPGRRLLSPGRAARRCPISSPRCRGAPSRVLAETRARLARAGAAWHELAILRDVDTAEDARAEGLLT